MEEVLDNATRLVLYDLLNRGDLRSLEGVVNSGKESRVYYGTGLDGKPRAIKIHLTSSAVFRKRLPYIAGDRRFKKVPRSSRGIVKLWVRKEFKNLQTAFSSGVRVPRPFAFKENVLVMEYIGEPPFPAPTFAETEVYEEDYGWTFDAISRLYKDAKLIHADLSEFNIFKFHEERIMFDMGSAVDITHPQASEFLRRDITNMVHFFSKRGIFHKKAEFWLEKIVS
jgi:RIO kinase 1